jgi:aminomethyltransferase
MLKRTPFYEKHLANQGKMVEFAGYEMPVQFEGIIAEHNRVRTTVGVFDVSHMGRIKIFGKDRFAFVNHVTTNNVSELDLFQAQYSVFCYPDGGIVDDLVVYNLPDCILLVVNGANNEKDTEWLLRNKSGDVRIENQTEAIAQLAVQGPKAEMVLQKITEINLSAIKFYWSCETKVAGVSMLVSRTGYTGEDGFELYFDAQYAASVWEAIFAAGKDFAIAPIGLGARDTLRLEMKYCLYGNDIDQTTNPLEAGLGFVTKLDKPEGFIGCEALKAIKAKGLLRKLVGFEMMGNAIPRPHYEIFSNGKKVGFVTSGTLSPSLKKGIGLGYVKAELSNVGQELQVNIRGTNAPAIVVKTPFYKQGTRK